MGTFTVIWLLAAAIVAAGNPLLVIGGVIIGGFLYGTYVSLYGYEREEE